MTSNYNKDKISDEAVYIDEMARRADMEAGMIEEDRFMAHMAEKGDVEAFAPGTDENLELLIRRGHNEHLNNNRFVSVSYGKYDEAGEREEKSRKFDYHDLAIWLMNETNEHYITLNDKGGMFYYSDGIYVKNASERIIYIIDGVIDGMMSNTRNRNEVLNIVAARTAVDRDEVDSDDNIINMANGLYHIDTGKLMSHTPSYLSFSKLGASFDPDATCPAFDKFVKEVVEPYRQDAIYELFGYTMMPKKPLKLGVIFSGPSDTGKSTMIAALHEFVGGDQNVSLVSPVAVGSDIHAPAGMYGKLLNYVDDLGTSPMLETGLVKSVISGKPINANEKYGRSFDFVPRVLMLFACNLVPTCSDDNLANKFDIFEFNNVFSDGMKNISLEDDLTTPEEMSGIFNKAMVGAKNALANKAFTGTKSIRDRESDFEFRSNPISQFVNDCCNMDDVEASVDKKVFRQAYVAWSNKKNVKVMQVGACTTWLQDHEVMLSRRGSVGEQVWSYVGIDIVGDKGGDVPPSTTDTEFSGHEDNHVTAENVAAAIYITTYSRGKKTFVPADILISMDRGMGATVEKVKEIMQTHSRELKITCVGNEWSMISG